MIFTFYSYKGGVGRSMALANVAGLLCRRGLRVLMIDFDLEAPGLEEFFPVDPRKVRRQPGLIDLLASYKQAMARDPLAGEDPEAQPSFKRLDGFIAPIYPDLPSRGKLELLPAGQRAGAHGDDEPLARYAHALRTFDWQDFYFKWGGELFFEWLRRELHERYDAVLVDSRTGVTEMGGVCAYQLADALVMLCASNVQNVEGVLSVVRNFSSPRVERLRRGRSPQLLIVPARVEQSDSELLADFRRRFEAAFGTRTPEALAAAGVSFWDLAIPYEPRYAFEERVASPGEDDRRPDEAFRRLAEAMAHLAPPGSRLGELTSPRDTTRGGFALGVAEAPVQYDATRITAGYDVYLSYRHDDSQAIEVLTERLEVAGLRLFLDRWHLEPDELWEVALEEALGSSRSCAVFVGRGGLGAWQNEVMRFLLERWREDPDFRILPVLLPGADVSLEALPRFLREVPCVDFRAGLDDEAAFEQLVTGIRGEEPGPRAPASFQADAPPYPGLAPFGEEDAGFFFGREDLVQRLLEHLEKHRCAVLVGPSGCGKSSLAMAGLVPALRRGGVSGSEGWRFVVLRPGARPLRRLAEALASALASVAPEELETALYEAPDQVTAWVERSMRERGAIVLVVDQLEEAWTAEPAERDLFALRLLAGLSGLLSLRLILTLRSDFLAQAQEQPDLSRLLTRNQLDVHPLDREALRRAIEEPARRAGLAFEPGLVDAILNDAKDQPGALPLVQALLAELWQARQSGFLTLAAYQRLGGVASALSCQAEALLTRLPERDQELTRRILPRLVRLGDDGASPARRRASLEELGFAAPLAEVRRVIDRLVAARLVSVDRDEHGVSVEIAHEVLITHWPRLRRWLEEERESLWTEQRLLAAARDWEQSGRDPALGMRGARLAEAEAWLRDHGGRVGGPLQAYLSASIGERRRRRRTLTVATAVSAAGILAALSISTRLRSEVRQAEGRLVELNRGVQELAAGDVRGQVETLSPDGRLFVRELEGGLWLGAAADGAEPQPALFTSEAPILDFAFSADSRTFALAAADGSASLYDVEAGSRIRLAGHQGAVHALAFRPSDQALATVGEDGTLRLWDRASGVEIFRVRHPEGMPFRDVDFDREGERILTTDASGQVMIWDAFSGRRLG